MTVLIPSDNGRRPVGVQDPLIASSRLRAIVEASV